MNIENYILFILSKSEGYMTYSEINEMCVKYGFTEGQVAGKLRDLVKKDKVLRPKRGRYILNEKNELEMFKYEVNSLLKKYRLEFEKSDEGDEFYNYYKSISSLQ